MPNEPDAELIRRAAGGDVDAVAALYDRHAATLLGAALRLMGTRFEAEDVVHDVFVSLPDRARHYIAERGSVLAWMAILVRNAGIDRIRRYGRAALAGQEQRDLSSAVGLEQPDPEADAIAASARTRVLQALAALPDAQRSALEAAFFEGLSYLQIAERQGVSLNTVKSRCARAMAVLREALADVRDISKE